MCWGAAGENVSFRITCQQYLTNNREKNIVYKKTIKSTENTSLENTENNSLRQTY